MLRTRRALCLVALCSTFIVGACAEGTKVDVPSGHDVGGGTGRNAGGASGTGSVTLGGVPAKSGSQSKPPSAGSASTPNSVSSGGKTFSVGGSSMTGSGSATDNSGGDTAAGGTAAVTVVAPTSGLGIKIVSQSKNGQNASATNLALVNVGDKSVDLTTVKIRYYFTIDGWTTPVWEIDYAGQVISKASISTNFFTVSPARVAADRYFELSFKNGSLGANAQLDINSRLYDFGNATANLSNDYSFTGTTGFTDRITIYVADQLVWGVEPGTEVLAGTGGVSGVAGASSVGGGGSSSSGGDSGAAGALGFAGSAGTS